MIKPIGEWKRSDWVWASMYFALLMTVCFGLVENYFVAWLFTMYMLIVVLCNLIDEHRKQIKKAHRAARR